MKKNFNLTLYFLLIAVAALPQPNTPFDYPKVIKNQEILDYLSQINADTLVAHIQALENFFTRRCDHPNSILAQNWVAGKLKSYDLELFLYPLDPPIFPWWGGVCVSENVVAIQYGTEFPDEFVVCGGHYDSFAFLSSHGEPGADDNATGAAGIIETARILSQHKFKRSIIYCSFTAEESGMDGSRQYVEKCAEKGMKILGYINLDMTGYLTPGNKINFALIYPNSAQPLADYFVDICDVYLPEVPIKHYEMLPWGDSDHTSFNMNGYQGVWCFEDIAEITPYYHTPLDKLGCSVNNPEQVRVFTQANLASLATLAIPDREVNITEYDAGYQIYPNPTTGELRITNYELGPELNSGTDIEIYDIYGRKLSSHHLIPSSTNHLINISHLPAGIYLIKAGNDFIGKFIKN